MIKPFSAAIVLTLTGALALTACSNNQSEHAAPAAEGEHAATSSAGLPKGNPKAGETLATQGGEGIAPCVSCHGAQGNAPIDGMYPRIGGQYADYIAHALQAYRDGSRSGGTASVMAAQAKGLSDQQIADLAAYFHSVPATLRDLQNVN
jgi:cytochrome c553